MHTIESSHSIRTTNEGKKIDAAGFDLETIKDVVTCYTRAGWGVSIRGDLIDFSSTTLPA